MKRLIALTLAVVMMFALCACGGNTAGTTGQATTEPLTKDDVIKVATLSHASWPYREDWKVWEYIEEGTGATVDVNAIPSTDVGTKIAVMLASKETIPDVMYGDSESNAIGKIHMGATIALDDMEEYMPNYNAWLDSLTEQEYQNNVVRRKYSDGKIYYTPVIGREKSQNLRAWLYRKDIFEKHNLKTPETFDELYEVCKQLKELYPDSYPFCVRDGLNVFAVTGSSWQPYWRTNYEAVYYNHDTGKWSFGTTEPIMLEMVKFYKKLMDEKLINPDFLTINTNTWQELVATGRGFIMPEFQTRIDFFNSLARTKNPDFDLHAMIPPVATEQGLPMVNKYNVDQVGMLIMNTEDERRIANAAKYVDWFYTDEAYELVSWGKEGETYEVVDGKKQFITDETGTQANTLYGFGTYATFTRMDPEAVVAFESEDIAETRDMVLEHTMPYPNPLVVLNDEEEKVNSEYITALTMYSQEMITKFLLGQEPLSKWDEFVATANEMGVEKLVELYESAYNRITK